MRDILFRGKRKDNLEWIEGCNINSQTDIKGNQHIYMGLPVSSEIYSNMVTIEWVEVIPETVGEHTGLTDKNGKKIFEGDIFKFPDEIWESCYTSCGTEYDSWTVENYGVVGFREDTGGFDFIKYKFDENSVEADLHENHNIEFCEFVSDLEIVGNIHDNPDLLRGEKE